MYQWFDCHVQGLVVSQGISHLNTKNCPGFPPPLDSRRLRSRIAGFSAESELVFRLLITHIFNFLGSKKISSSSRCFIGRAELFYCGTPWGFQITILLNLTSNLFKEPSHKKICFCWVLIRLNTDQFVQLQIIARFLKLKILKFY